jgi:BirA family transcriptional regulator, biotin operon repressor / biotin---[acetyl-CoA-carboxylase] ligase
MTGGPPRLPPGYRLVRYETIGSTNDAAKELARAGAAAGTLVWAGEQTRGRGRRGRPWASPPGNLYLSLVLRPDCPVAAAAQLGFVAALAVGEALGEPAGLGYKWPNDILIDGCKVAGILLESEVGEGGRLAFLVVGIGVNIVSAPPASEFPAASLAAPGPAAPAPAALLERVVARFDTWAERWRVAGFAPVRAAWRERAVGLGATIRVRLESDALSGRFRDIDQEGTLLLETAAGCRHIAAGEVFPAG